MQGNRVEVTVFRAEGQPALRVLVAPESAGSAGSAESADARGAQPRVSAAPALSRSLDVLTSNLARPYYDEEEDAATREAYYRNILADVSPSERFLKLNELVRRTHSPFLGYSTARYDHLYVWVDLRENGMLRSIYTGQEYQPEDVIQDDFALETARFAQLRAWMVSTDTLGQTMLFSDVEGQLDALEDQGPYNCEHVVPQSWFKPRSLPMKGDLHHLFTCTKSCNEFRGNTPFGKTGRSTENCGKKLGNEFEPEEGKGAVARATLYFLLRYPGEINNKAQEYTTSDIATLLEWHLQEPVSLYERHRNAAIQEAQGNRNPLIDFPEWAEEIPFELGLG